MQIYLNINCAKPPYSGNRNRVDQAVMPTHEGVAPPLLRGGGLWCLRTHKTFRPPEEPKVNVQPYYSFGAIITVGTVALYNSKRSRLPQSLLKESRTGRRPLSAALKLESNLDVIQNTQSCPHALSSSLDYQYWLSRSGRDMQAILLTYSIRMIKVASERFRFPD